MCKHTWLISFVKGVKTNTLCNMIKRLIKKKGKAAVSGITNCLSFSANFCGFKNMLALSKQLHIYLKKKIKVAANS